MAFDPTYKMSIQNVNGNYYSAVQNAADGTWSVTTSPTLAYLGVLPDGWADLTIMWQRDTNYLGIYRSRSDQGFKFSKDARAIIQYIRSTQGIIGYGKLTIYIQNFSATALTFPIYYSSEFDFASYSDDRLARLVSINTLDGQLYRDLESKGDTPFNIPMWLNIGTVSDPIWVANADMQFVCHSGIKLLYNSTYASSATPDNLLTFSNILGWNRGRHGAPPTNDGYHTIPNMVPYNIVQNNGATTFIGNDILQPYLIQGSQHQGIDQPELNFSGPNNSQPYSRANNSMNDQLQGDSITMFASVSGQINGPIDCPGVAGGGQAMVFVLFEIGPNDVCTPDPSHPGNFSYIEILKIPLPDSATGFYYPPNIGTAPAGVMHGYFSNYAEGTRTVITLNPNRVYIFGVIFIADSDNSSYSLNVTFSALQFSLYSNFDSGLSGVPIPAPKLNPSVFPTMQLWQLLNVLTSYLPTTNADGYGFPLPVATDFQGKSTFLFDPTVLVKDVCPAQIRMTSSYCIHDLQGNPYITMSLKQLFNFCKKQLGCGMGIEYDVNGNPTILRIEDLGYFFDNTTMILDLGYDVTDLVITQLQEGLGANLKLGYTKANTNTDFGVDPIATELFFNTPASNLPGTMDFEESDVLTEQYAIEKTRAQIVSQPVGTSYDPANPSTDNQIIAIYCGKEDTQISLPNTGIYDFQPYDPSNNPVPCLAFTPVVYPNAQSTDSAAASAPYVFGAYYPDTYINIPLSPCRALGRGIGGFIHSVLDEMDGEDLTFRNTAIMQFNNEVKDLSGLESNLVVGSGAGNVTTEFKDIAISSLPAQLFKPIILKVKSKYPINMYQILNNNPNGYVRFFWNNDDGYGAKEYKGFISKVMQNAATNAPTEFELWATPDMVI